MRDEEQERSRNFIIHNLDEKGEDNDAIKEHDAKIIGKFLVKVAVVK